MIQESTHPSPVTGRILLAEDDPVVQWVTSQVLEQANYEVKVVDNGLEVLKTLASADYDLVLMDGSMPEMDGFEATHVIRDLDSDVRQHEIPIIALTALDSRGDRELCIEAGMNDYLEKPVDPDLLLSTIGRWLDDRTGVDGPDSQHGVPEASYSDDFMDTIIDRFLADVPQLIKTLEITSDKDDITGLKNIGHRIRGAADILGAKTLSLRAKALEQAAKTNDLMRTSQCTTQLIEALRLLTLLVEGEVENPEKG